MCDDIQISRHQTILTVTIVVSRVTRVNSINQRPYIFVIAIKAKARCISQNHLESEIRFRKL